MPADAPPQMRLPRTQKLWRVLVTARPWKRSGRRLASLELVCERYRLERAGLVEGRDFFVEWKSPAGGGWVQLMPGCF